MFNRSIGNTLVYTLDIYGFIAVFLVFHFFVDCCDFVKTLFGFCKSFNIFAF